MGISFGRALPILRTIARYGAKCGLFLISLVFPRSDTVWVFGAKGGEAFVDNSKYLYLYTVAEREHIRAVWLSRNEEVITELQERGYEAYHTDSLQGMWLNLRADNVFISHGMPDVNRWCSGGATTVVLWHGIALKRIGYGLQLGGPVERAMRNLKRTIRYNVVDRYNWFLVPSDAMAKPFSSAFRLDPERILPIGYPRNDFLVGSLPGFELSSEEVIYENCKELREAGTVLLYAPTKHPETNQSVDDQLRLSKLDQWLTERGAYLLLKPHPAEPLALDEEEFSRIIQVPEGIDIYPLLQYTDMLITDYSSIYFDYLLLDNPIVFYPFDLDEYRSTRGFYLNYEDVTPGPIATDFDELLRALDRTLESDEFGAQRRSVRERFIQPPGSHRCKTICDRFDPQAKRR